MKKNWVKEWAKTVIAVSFTIKNRKWLLDSIFQKKKYEFQILKNWETLNKIRHFVFKNSFKNIVKIFFKINRALNCLFDQFRHWSLSRIFCYSKIPIIKSEISIFCSFKTWHYFFKNRHFYLIVKFFLQDIYFRL